MKVSLPDRRNSVRGGQRVSLPKRRNLKLSRRRQSKEFQKNRLLRNPRGQRTQERKKNCPGLGHLLVRPSNTWHRLLPAVSNEWTCVNSLLNMTKNKYDRLHFMWASRLESSVYLLLPVEKLYCTS